MFLPVTTFVGLIIFAMLIFILKIIDCPCRTFVRLWYECGFALRLFDQRAEQGVELLGAEQLGHGGHAYKLFLKGIIACIGDSRCNSIGVCVSAVAASFLCALRDGGR